MFPNLLYGEEAAFEASTYLDTRGDKHRTVRGAWQPFFFSGRCAQSHPHCTSPVQQNCRLLKGKGPVSHVVAFGLYSAQATCLSSAFSEMGLVVWGLSKGKGMPQANLPDLMLQPVQHHPNVCHCIAVWRAFWRSCGMLQTCWLSL